MGAKSSVCPSKPRETKLFGGISRDILGVPKSLRKKGSCSILVPYGNLLPPDGGRKDLLHEIGLGQVMKTTTQHPLSGVEKVYD